MRVGVAGKRNVWGDGGFKRPSPPLYLIGLDFQEVMGLLGFSALEQYILSRMGALWSWGSSPPTSLSSSLSLLHSLSFYPFFPSFFFFLL